MASATIFRTNGDLSRIPSAMRSATGRSASISRLSSFGTRRRKPYTLSTVSYTHLDVYKRQAIHLVEPDPVKPSGPTGFPRNQALISDGPDWWLNGRSCQSWQVLVDAGVSQCRAETATQPASRASFKLKRECREDVVASEQRIKNCNLIAPSPPYKSPFKQVDRRVCGDACSDACRNALEAFLCGLAYRSNPVI